MPISADLCTTMPVWTTSTGDDRMTATWHHPHPRTVLVRVFGEVDLGTASRLRRVLGDAVRHVAPDGPAPAPDDRLGRRPQVVGDLSGVAFLGAAGLGALVETDHTARVHHVGLQVVAGSRRMRRTLAVAGLDGDLDIVERLADLTPSGLRATPEHSA